MIGTSRKVGTKFTIPEQRTTIAEKRNPKWYIDNANYWIYACIANHDKIKTKKFFDAADGLINKKTYDYVLKSYTDKCGEERKLYGELRDIDFLAPITEKYMGEFINTFNEFKVYNNDASVVLARNEVIANKVMSWVNQAVINKLNESGMDTGQPSVNQDELEYIVNVELEKWMDDVTITSQHRLNIVNAVNEAVRVYEECWYNFYASEECYTYRWIENGEVKFEAVSPFEYYRLDSGNRFIEDDNAGCRRWQMSIADVIAQYRDILTDKEIQYMKENYTNNKVTTPDEALEFIKRLDDFGERKWTDDLKSDVTLYLNNFSRDKVWVHHYVFTTEIPNSILTYRDLLGEVKTINVDSDYKFDESKGDISIETEWIDQVWEGWRFGGDIGGVYTVPKPVDCQREVLSNISRVKLPYNGIVGLHPNRLRNPIPYRVLPYMALYRIYTLQQERAIAKFKSFITLPESIMSDSPDMSTTERFIAAVKDGYYPFDDVDANANSLQSIREVSNNGLIDYIRVLEEQKQQLKSDAWESAHYNTARAGEVKDYGTKGVTENNYDQAITGSIWSYQVLGHFIARDSLANIDYSKFAWVDGKQTSYIDPATGEIIIADIDGTSDVSSDLGIYSVSANKLQQQIRELKDIAFNASQNGEVEAAIEAVTSDSPTAIKKSIKAALEATRKFNREMATAEQEAVKEAEQIRAEAAAEQRQWDGEQKQLDRDAKIREIEVAGDKKIELERLRWNTDLDHNGYVDKNEAAIANGMTQADVNQVEMAKALKK